VDLRIERGRTTRERLIAIGFHLFGARGYEATPVSALLDAAGIARGAFYHHFPTKADLFDAVLDRVIAHVAEQSVAAARAFDDPVESMRAACATWLDSALDPAVQRIVLLDAEAVVGWDRCRELDEQHTLGRLKATLRRIARSGRLPGSEEVVGVLAHMLLAAVGEAAMLIARAEDPAAARTTGQIALDQVLTGLISPGPPVSPAPAAGRAPSPPPAQ
jgi:AcrR family transcriptional regulator